MAHAMLKIVLVKEALKNNMLQTERLQQAVENALIGIIRSGDAFKLPYENRIDLGSDLEKAYKLIDYEKVYTKVTSLLEEEIAKKIVNKIVTEMGNDMKKLMSNTEIREDFKYFMRKGVEKILDKVEK